MKSDVTAKFAGFLTIAFLILFQIPAYASDPLALPNLLPETDKDALPNLDQDDVSRFTNSVALINEFYVKPTEEKKIFENAIRGIVAGLDTSSEYLDEPAYKTYLLEKSGNLTGVGLDVVGEYEALKVISPIDDTPAFKAGILPGDYIVAINNQFVSNMSLDEAIAQIYGKKDSSITLTILRKGADKPLNITLKRDNAPIQSVKSKMLDNGFGYVRISQFQELTAQQMIAAINELNKNEKLKGLVLDLRNNPSGKVSDAVKVANAFLDSANLQKYNKMIVSTKGNLPQFQYEAKADSTDVLQGIPLIVLINQGTASAAEVVAGALQDYHRATLVGNTSFGKGSVQSVIPIDKTHALKLTTALYYTPSGKQIQTDGIKPDVLVENLKVTSSNADSSIMGPIREFELKNQFLPKNANKKVINSSEDFTDLAQQDFQLYQALKMLQMVSNIDSKTLVKN
ncbi:MAG: S41 family peptidase [Gammaproteobacteria bacterium]|nr:S41 family peptidase [Gammaproteobacteria bacterium]